MCLEAELKDLVLLKRRIKEPPILHFPQFLHQSSPCHAREGRVRIFTLPVTELFTDHEGVLSEPVDQKEVIHAALRTDHKSEWNQVK